MIALINKKSFIKGDHNPLRRFLSILSAVGVLSGCSISERPFVWTDPLITITKQLDWLHRFGAVVVCYDGQDAPAARVLAADTCAEYGLKSRLVISDRMQCKMTAPNRMIFQCYDPKMRFSSGAWVNPLSKNQIKMWQDEQMARTGKSRNEIYAGPTRVVPEAILRNDVDAPMVLNQPSR